MKLYISSLEAISNADELQSFVNKLTFFQDDATYKFTNTVGTETTVVFDKSGLWASYHEGKVFSGHWSFYPHGWVITTQFYTDAGYQIRYWDISEQWQTEGSGHEALFPTQEGAVAYAFREKLRNVCFTFKIM